MAAVALVCRRRCCQILLSEPSADSSSSGESSTGTDEPARQRGKRSEKCPLAGEQIRRGVRWFVADVAVRSCCPNRRRIPAAQANPRRGLTNQHGSVGSARASVISKKCRPAMSVGHEAIRPSARGTGGMGATTAGGVIRALCARAPMLEVCRNVRSQGNRSGVVFAGRSRAGLSTT